MNRILVVGANAREHALAKALLRSNYSLELFILATHDHIALREVAVDFCLCPFDEKITIIEFIKRHGIQYAIIGGELPLALGMVDMLSDVGVQCIGPTQTLAKIESSKAYARELMVKHRIHGAPEFRVCHTRNEVDALRSQFRPQEMVIKADGLMGGKGVSVGGEHFSTFDEVMQIVDEVFNKGQHIVIEEKLIGEEFSLMAFCDGRTVVPMPCVRDFKRAFEGNTGPNTGGMGSYSLANHRLPFLSADDVETALFIMKQTVTALQSETRQRYCGILYGGFMKTVHGISVIEFNARFGDPEVLNVLSVLQTDFFDVVQAMATSSLDKLSVRFVSLATVCKYVVPHDYPHVRASAERIDFSLIADDPHLYLGSFGRDERGEYYTASSRTLAYVGAAETLEKAAKNAELAVEQIKGKVRYRQDIPFEVA